MCRPKSFVLYIEACGHYKMSQGGQEIPLGACSQAIKRRISDQVTEWSPCATLICELEAQRKDRWEWEVTMDDVLIHVGSHSSGHCTAWLKKGFKPPDYRALAEAERAERAGNQNREKEEEGVATSGSGTLEPSPAVDSGVSITVSTTTEVDDPKWEHSRREGKKNRFKRRLLSLLN